MVELIRQILMSEGLEPENLEKSKSGFTNEVYLTDGYVVKMTNDVKVSQKLKKEISFYSVANLEFLPKFVAAGELDDTTYLITERLEGCGLYKIWHTLSQEEKENVVKQIAEILSEFHRQPTDFLEERYVFNNWKEKWKKSFSKNIKILKGMGKDTTYLSKFARNKLYIFDEQKYGLVYNDAHFDNFIYNDGIVKLIDFDRVIGGSLDYEVLIISMMLDDPTKFASEDEKFVKKKDYDLVLEWLKKYCPEMFDFEFFEDRLFVYKFIYRLGQGYEYHNEKLIDSELERFKERFFAKHEKHKNGGKKR